MWNKDGQSHSHTHVVKPIMNLQLELFITFFCGSQDGFCIGFTTFVGKTETQFQNALRGFGMCSTESPYSWQQRNAFAIFSLGFQTKCSIRSLLHQQLWSDMVACLAEWNAPVDTRLPCQTCGDKRTPFPWPGCHTALRNTSYRWACRYRGTQKKKLQIYR